LGHLEIDWLNVFTIWKMMVDHLEIDWFDDFAIWKLIA
jgi:hypothetical protein